MMTFSSIFNRIQHLRTRLRTSTWSHLFFKFGKGSRVLGSITVYFPNHISIGTNTSLNVGVLLNARDPITIGNNVHISPHVLLNAGGLNYKKKGGARDHSKAPINICDGVWIGSGAIINPGVTIGQNSVIGAGAVVTKDIPANVVAVGVPAKVLKNID